jgi:hypothetical protein
LDDGIRRFGKLVGDEVGPFFVADGCHCLFSFPFPSACRIKQSKL